MLGEAAMVTLLDDREGDIYEKWARLPDARTQLLTRAITILCMGRTLMLAQAAALRQARIESSRVRA